MTVDELLAREGIRHTIASYAMAGDSLRAADYAACFAEDALFEFPGFATLPAFRFEGRAAILASVEGWGRKDEATAPSPLTFLRHHITSCRIELTGPDSARARSYWAAYTDIGPDHIGTYSDRFRKAGDDWLIAHRLVRVDWRSPDSLFPPASH